MTIIIENASPLPIYEQIIQQVRSQILSGELKEGEMLPSMRVLAKELRISVITTKRAYEELERDGFIVSITGKGSFVNGKNLDIMREEYLKNIEKLFGEAIKNAALCGLNIEDLKEMLETIYEEENNG